MEKLVVHWNPTCKLLRLKQETFQIRKVKFVTKMKSMLEKLKMINDKQLRSGGIIFALIGFFIIWFIKG